MSLYQDQRPSSAATGGAGAALAAAPQTPAGNAPIAITTASLSGPSSPRRQILDLRRLLHAMSRSNADVAANCSDTTTSSSSAIIPPPYVIRDRIDLSQSMLAQIRHTIYHRARSDRVANIDALAAQADDAHLNIDYERLMRQVEQMREEHVRECQREDVTMEELRREVDLACRDAEEQLRTGIAKGSDGDRREEKDIIDALFFSTDDTVNGVGLIMQDEGRGWEEDGATSSDDYSLGLDDDDDGNANDRDAPDPDHDGTPRPSSPRTATTSHQPHRNRHHHSHNPNHAVTDQESEDVKRQQADMLETEIAEMAAQMKSATLRMNTTLKEQTNALDDMEDVVTENLDNVTDVTEKVETHVRRGWKKTAKTWSLLLSVIGTFAFLFVTMRAAPKRRDACLFFCDRSRRYRDDEYERMLSLAEEERLRLLEELRMRNGEVEDDAAAAAAAAEGDEEGDGNNDDDKGEMVCETLANGSVQCFGVREKPTQDRKSQRRQKTDEAAARSVHVDPGCSGGGGGEPDDSKSHDEVLAAIMGAATEQAEPKSDDDTEPESEEVDAEDEEDSEDDTPEPEHAPLTEEERQKQKEEDEKRREVYAKRRAIEDEIREKREREAIEEMGRLKREKNKEADMQNAEAFKAYSNYKKRAREELLEQKKKRDSLIEKEEAQRLAGAEHIAAENAEQERLGAKNSDAEPLVSSDMVGPGPLEADRLAEAERIAAEKAKRERQEQDRVAAEKAEQERLEQERTAAEKAHQERLAQEQSVPEKASRELTKNEQISAEKANRERLKNEQMAAEKANLQQLEQRRVVAEKAKQERLEAVRLAETKRLASERANADRGDQRATEQAEQRAEGKLDNEADEALTVAEKKAEELVQESEEERLRKKKQASARAKVEREAKKEKSEESQKRGARSEL